MCAILAPDYEVHSGSVCGGAIIPRQRRRVPRSRLTSRVLVLGSLPLQSMAPWLPQSCCFSRGDCGVTVSMWRRCNHCSPSYLEAYPPSKGVNRQGYSSVFASKQLTAQTHAQNARLSAFVLAPCWDRARTRPGSPIHHLERNMDRCRRLCGGKRKLADSKAQHIRTGG